MRTLIFAFLLGGLFQGFGQKNTVFVELLGNGIFASLNYELQLTKEPGLVVRLGLGYIPPTFESSKITVPISLLYMEAIGKKSYVEFGLGSTLIPAFEDDPCGLVNFGGCSKETKKGLLQAYLASIGYRKYFGKDQNWVWKFNFSPVIGRTFDGRTEFGFSPWAGIAIGKRF
ncbi:MAG: hypothetical protein WBM77_07555 [Maribacter sp.]